MTNPTDPQIEAAARALCQSSGVNPDALSSKLMDYRVLEENWKKYIQKAEIALKAADEAAWLPIESAPKDGTQILAFDGQYQELVTWERGLWWCDPGLTFSPTHWQPLPKAPKP